MRQRFDDLPPLPAGLSSPAEPVGRWYVAAVESCQERKVAAVLSRPDFENDRPGIKYYLPQYQVTGKDAAGKRRTWQRVLFPGYVFFCCRDGEDLFAVTQRAEVLDVLSVHEKAQPTLVAELAALHAALSASGMTVDPYAFAAEGSRCRVRRGALEGTEGTVIRRDGVHKLVLLVTILGTGAMLDIDPDELEAV